MKPSSSTIIAQLQDQNARLFLELQQVKRVANDLQCENESLQRKVGLLEMGTGCGFKSLRLYEYKCGTDNDLMYSENPGVNGCKNSGFFDVLANNTQPISRCYNDAVAKLQSENDDLRSVIEAQKIVSGLALNQGGQHE